MRGMYQNQEAAVADGGHSQAKSVPRDGVRTDDGRSVETATTHAESTVPGASARSFLLSPSGRTSEAGRIAAKRPFTLFNPGWLFVFAAVGILACTMLIPAQLELEDARWARDRALDAQKHRDERLANYRNYVKALDEGQPALVMSLAASQLNQIPADRAPIPGMTEAARADASVYAALEPAPMKAPERRKMDSVLVRLTTNETIKLWLIAGGVFCLMLGLLPASRARGEVPNRD